MPSVELSPEAYAVLCGLVQPSDDAAPDGVNHAGIFTATWDEIRAAFPAKRFHVWAASHEDFYDPDAGT